MAMDGWQALKCECGGDEFIEITKIMWKQGGGTVPSKVGYVCESCDVMLDVNKAVQLKRIGEMRSQLAALEEAGY